MTCTEVKVIEQPAADRTSYCSMIEEREKALPRSEATVGQATIFLSFAYISDFLAVFRCLQDHMAANVEDFEHQYIWISLFSVNQHDAVMHTGGCDRVCSLILKIIKLTGHVIVLAFPYNRPVVLTRAWNVWEIYCALKTNSKLEIVL